MVPAPLTLQEENLMMPLIERKEIERNDANSVPKIKGPIRCHKCRLTCRDAEHYLSHTCEPRPKTLSQDAVVWRAR